MLDFVDILLREAANPFLSLLQHVAWRKRTGVGLIERLADLVQEIRDAQVGLARGGGGAISPRSVRKHRVGLRLHGSAHPPIAFLDFFNPLGEAFGGRTALLDEMGHLPDKVRYVLQFQIETQYTTEFSDVRGDAAGRGLLGSENDLSAL
jgi:hypothetical protein